MIGVARAPEPENFSTTVGVKGQKLLRTSNLRPPVESKFWKGKEHWRDALDELGDSYSWVCAYAAMRIERVTGSRSVEHFKPISIYPSLAYDWNNFRLVCGLMNGRKGNFEDVLDPFEIAVTERIFDLNPLSGEIRLHIECPQRFKKLARTTIQRLKLDDARCNQARLEHIDSILKKDWSEAESKRQSPFVFARLREQGLI